MTRILPPAAVVDEWTPEQQERYQQRSDQPDGVRRIDGSGMTKEEYAHQAAQAYDADVKRLVQLQQKKAWLEDVMRLRLLFDEAGAIDKKFDTTLSSNAKANERLDDLNKKIEALEKDIKYNVENLNNTFPNANFSPVLPSPPNEFYVCATAPLMCPCAIPIPSMFVPDPSRTVFMKSVPMGNINDFKPSNFTPMGACTNPANPAVIPPYTPSFPCVAPVTTSPWTKGKVDVFIQGAPALLSTDGVQCSYGGRILVMPDPSYLDNAASLAVKKLRDKLAEETIEYIAKKAGKKIPGVGIIVTEIFEAKDQISGDWDRAMTMEEADRRAEKRREEFRSATGIELIEKLPSVPSDIIKSGGDWWTAQANEHLGEPGARAVGFVVAIAEGVGDTVELAGDVMVGAAETGAAHTLVQSGSPSRQWNDSDVFGSDEEAYYQ